MPRSHISYGCICTGKPSPNGSKETPFLSGWCNLKTQSSNTSILPYIHLFYLFWVLRRFQHCTGHITTSSWKGRGNQYIQFVRVLYCKLPTNGKQLPAFPLEAVPGTKPRPQRWEEKLHQGQYTEKNISPMKVTILYECVG